MLGGEAVGGLPATVTRCSSSSVTLVDIQNLFHCMYYLPQRTEAAMYSCTAYTSYEDAMENVLAVVKGSQPFVDWPMPILDPFYKLKPRRRGLGP